MFHKLMTVKLKPMHGSFTSCIAELNEMCHSEHQLIISCTIFVRLFLCYFHFIDTEKLFILLGMTRCDLGFVYISRNVLMRIMNTAIHHFKPVWIKSFLDIFSCTQCNIVNCLHSTMPQTTRTCLLSNFNPLSILFQSIFNKSIFK